MIGIVAKIKIKDGMNEQFERVAKELVAAVNANEPHCSLYALHRGEDPNLYVFMERYLDQAAVDNHRQQEHFRKLGRKMGEYMDGPPEVIRMQEVV